MLKRFSIYWFKKNGWRFIGGVPRRAGNFIVVYGPHRKPSDYLLALAVKRLTYFRVSFVLEKRRRTFWVRYLLRVLGITQVRSVDRKADFELLADTLQHQDRAAYAFSYTPLGKPDEAPDRSFYQLAHECRSSILLVAIDRRKKVVKFHNPFHTSGYLLRDMSYIHSFFTNYYNYDKLERGELELVNRR